MQDPSFNHSLPRFGWRCGTFNPSHRQIRSTRFLFTIQPELRSSAVIRRYPYRPYCRASVMMSSVRAASSPGVVGGLRCVARGCPKTLQANRSDTASLLTVCRTQSRRRAGLRSFPMQLP